MAIYNAPTEDVKFILHDVLRIHERNDIEGYADLTDDMTGAIFEEAGKIATEVLLPINETGDKQGCVLENGVVRTPDGFKEAYTAMCEGGWPGIDCNPEYGGQGMPYIVHAVTGEFSSSAAMAFSMYQGLTHGAIKAIEGFGSESQKEMYLPKMISGAWTGTMNLTEPHCGTDLGLLRTKAEPQDDGSYKISGQKIFISAGEHDLSENIVHLVLAKIPGGPEGVKGISLFVVPKFVPNDDGSLGNRNTLSCGKLEEKMGIHGNSTCVMNYDEATGWLVGDEHKGLRAMFLMMNEARLLVGMQGLSQAAIAYQNAVEYAKDRLQGRALDGDKFPDQKADPLMVHPDVRRMLMDGKGFVEGGRAFYYWASSLIDEELHHEDEKVRDQAGLLIALLTPVVKGFLTDKGFDVAVQMQQVFGGHGYTEDWSQSQFVRDARIAMIYEGANGVQALDLIGRKLPQKGGAGMQTFFGLVKDFCKENDGDEMSEFVEPVKAASKELQEAVMWFMQHGMKDPNQAAAGSTDFLHLFGHTAIAFMWAKMAKTAQDALAGNSDNPAFYEAKIKTARYYMQRVLPATSAHLARIKSGADTVMALEADAF
jgi:alkylation response protein AidB-like acyl-CoA dehydrogenase